MNLPSGDAARWCGPSNSTGTSPTGTSPSLVPAMGSTYDSVSDRLSVTAKRAWCTNAGTSAAGQLLLAGKLTDCPQPAPQPNSSATRSGRRMCYEDSMSDLPDAARAFADGDVDLLPAALPDAAGDALVGVLVERGDAAGLQRLGDGADKALAKRARKA